MIKPLFAEFFARLIPSVHIDSWGEPAPALLSQPWRSAGVPPPSQRERRQWEKMLLGKTTNKTAQRTCGGEALVLRFNPRQIWGLQTPRCLLGWGGFKVCEEVWMCLWKDSILLVLIKPFLSRIPPCSVLFLQLPGLEWELQPLSCPTGIFSLIPPLPQNPGGIRHVPGSLIRTPGCCRALLPLPFPPGASGTSQQISRSKKSRFFF